MSEVIHPTTAAELRDALRDATASHNSVELFGANSKKLMAGPVAQATTQISTTRLNRILQYEPRDLTISVEAGILYADLSRELARNRQMIPLSGPYSNEATIGGIVAANINESRRRAYGTARDLVIGMEFATLEGKLVRSGGMVVKNVAGLDMGKLMIGSFGTLAAIATLNFKLLPIPEVSRTLLFQFEDLKSALTLFQNVTKNGLNPIAADLFNPILSAQFGAQFGVKGFLLALQFGGNNAVIERCTRETNGSQILSLEEEGRFWNAVAAITPRHLEKFQDAAVVRISAPLSECADAFASSDNAAHAMIASGVVRSWFSRTDAASRWLASAVKHNWKGVIEFAGPRVNRSELALWPSPGGDFEIMKKIKHMFDPEDLLNRGRLHNLI